MKKLLFTVLLFFLINSLSFAQLLAPESSSASSYAVDTSGTLFAWGFNQHGQLGRGNTADTITLPVIVYIPGGLISIRAISAGFQFCLAIGNDGNLYAWGANDHGQLGTGDLDDRYYPEKINFPAGVTRWIAISAGESHSLAIGNDGNLYSWGLNSDGELGLGDTTSRSTPTLVPFPNGVSGWKVIAAGSYFSLAIGNDGNLYGWGQNNRTQLGIGNDYFQLSPFRVPLPNGVTSWNTIAAGGYHTLAIGSDGNLYSWGNNTYGQLGLGNGNIMWTPNLVPLPNGVSGWSAIAAGGYHSLAISADGALYSWGLNVSGQLGLGELDITDNQDSPHNVWFPNGVTTWKSVSAGSYHSLAVGNDGNLYAWGSGGQGQLGLGDYGDRDRPNLIIRLGSITGISGGKTNLPSAYSLSQNYPNPFNPTTTIEYSVPKSSFVSIKVYDILGREVATLVNGEKSPGKYSVVLNGSRLTSGIYLYTMKAGNFMLIKKLLFVK